MIRPRMTGQVRIQPAWRALDTRLRGSYVVRFWTDEGIVRVEGQNVITDGFRRALTAGDRLDNLSLLLLSSSRLADVEHQLAPAGAVGLSEAATPTLDDAAGFIRYAHGFTNAGAVVVARAVGLGREIAGSGGAHELLAFDTLTTPRFVESGGSLDVTYQIDFGSPP